MLKLAKTVFFYLFPPPRTAPGGWTEARHKWPVRLVTGGRFWFVQDHLWWKRDPDGRIIYKSTPETPEEWSDRIM